MSSPLLSIASITYNHEKYIAQAIESWLMQKTDFDIEIVIGEDCSTDNTRSIIEGYRLKHPDLIRVITSETNVGMMPNFIRTLEACKGKYIALCEGDDYWTDPLKLQKQVDFLEGNQDYSGCFHNSYWNEENTKQIYELETQILKDQIKLEDVLLYGRFIQTQSLVFRNFLFSYPIWFQKILSGDQALVLFISKAGLIKFLPETMGVYRKHNQGISRSVDSSRFYLNNIFLYKQIKKEIGSEYHNLVNRQILKWHGYVFLYNYYNKRPLFCVLYLIWGSFYIKSVKDIKYYFRDFMLDIFRKKKEISIGF